MDSIHASHPAALGSILGLGLENSSTALLLRNNWTVEA